MKTKTFYEPILQSDVIFITGSTPKEVEQYLKKRKYTNVGEYGSTEGSVTLLDEMEDGKTVRSYLVVVEDKKDFYTLLHETVHLTMHILDDHLIPIKADNGEIFAYYQTYWFKKLWRFMNTTNKKPS